MTSTHAPDAFHIADLFEAVTAGIPDRLALIAGEIRRTFADP